MSLLRISLTLRLITFFNGPKSIDHQVAMTVAPQLGLQLTDIRHDSLRDSWIEVYVPPQLGLQQDGGLQIRNNYVFR